MLINGSISVTEIFSMWQGHIGLYPTFEKHILGQFHLFQEFLHKQNKTKNLFLRIDMFSLIHLTWTG